MSATNLVKDAVTHPVTSINQVRRNWPLLVEMAKTREYSEAYRRFQNARMAEAPKASVGGWGDGIGQLQFDFLRERGLDPRDDLLDVGCGTLRAGRYLINYLDAGYTGMDISEEAIRQGETLLDDETRQQEYRLLSNHDLRFREFQRDEFDAVLAQSVLTHLPEDDAEEMLTHLPDVLDPDGRFYATINRPEDGSDYRPAGVRTYRYSVEKLVELGDEQWEADLLSHCEYPHPRGQEMVEFRLRE